MNESSADSVNYEGQSAYDVADMLKQFFRDLPEPLMTNKLSETFLQIYQCKWWDFYSRSQVVICVARVELSKLLLRALDMLQKLVFPFLKQPLHFQMLHKEWIFDVLVV